MPPKHFGSKHHSRSSSQRRRSRGAPARPASLRAAPVPEASVGGCLRALRDARGWSTRELAEQSGLAMNTLSLIENAKTSPSVSTLQQIARALDVPITAFFETGAPKTSVVQIKANRRTRVAFAHGALEDLGAGLSHRAVQPFVVTLEPHAGSGPNPIVHTGCEFVYCLQGRLTYTIQDRTYLLEPGDSLLFESHLPHHWQNVEATPSQALLVLCPSDARDRPTEFHFVPKPTQV